MIPFEQFFWLLKHLFPGDPDFTLESYGDLSYGYVLAAVSRGTSARQRHLYEQELPIAQQSAIIANQNRDSKRKKEPFRADDFSFFKPKSLTDLPSAKYGSAAMLMVKEGTFPAWALFCFKELSSIADTGYTPGVAALVSENAILLHPVRNGDGYRGMLIARESAGNQQLEFSHPNGSTVWLTVPPVRTKVVAEEGVILYP